MKPRIGSNRLKDGKFRKLAVYGRRSSGKTCILAALAMSRLPNPLGHATIWVSDVEHVPPVPDREQRPQNDPEIRRFDGKNWLQKQIELLRTGKLPEANPLAKDPYNLLYQFSTGPQSNIASIPKWQQGINSYFVEMVDYSGELVNADNDMAFQQTLLEHLDDCDGLLILAEAPRPGQEHAALHEELNQLIQALARVAERRKKRRDGPLPTALILNKWDRLIDNDQLSAIVNIAIRPGQDTVRQAKAMADYELLLEESVDRFFALMPPVPQHSLTNVLRAVAGDEQYFKSFPLSALGKCDVVSEQGVVAKDVPLNVNPLLSFGIEDPFVWICRATDRLLMESLEEKSAKLKWWSIPQLISRNTLILHEEAILVKALHPSRHPFAQLASRASTKATFFAVAQRFTACCVLSLLILLTSLIGISLYDSNRWRNIDPLLSADAAVIPNDQGLKEWQDAEAYARDYSATKWYRIASYLFVRGPAKAEDALPRIQQRLSEWESLRQQEERLLANIDGFKKSIDDSFFEDGIQKNIEQLTRLKVGPETPRALAQRDSLITAGRLKIDSLKRDKELSTAIKEINDYLDRGNIVEAARYISSKKLASDSMDKLKSMYIQKAPSQFSRKIESMLPDKSDTTDTKGYDLAVSEVKRFRNDSDVRSILGSTLADNSKNIEEWLRAMKDRTLYVDCSTGTERPEKFRRYLDELPDGNWRVVVQKRYNYVAWLQKPSKWRITVDKINLRQNGAQFGKAGIKTNLELSSGGGTEEKDWGKRADNEIIETKGHWLTTDSVTPSTQITISIKLKPGYWFDDPEALGTATWKGQIDDFIRQSTVEAVFCNGTKDFAKGSESSLKSSKQKDKLNTVTFSIEGKLPDDASKEPLEKLKGVPPRMPEFK